MIYITENKTQEIFIPKFAKSEKETTVELKLHSVVLNKDLTFAVLDKGTDPNFYVFELNSTILDQISEGEWVYQIDDSKGLWIKRTSPIKDSCTNIQYDAKPVNTEYFVD